MPSPLGHLLGGVAVAAFVSGSADDLPGSDARLKPDATIESPDATKTPKPGATTDSRPWFFSPLLMTAAFIAAAPDLDLIVKAWHRKGTHSLLATALVMIVTMLVTGKVTGRIQWRWVWVLGAAHGSHLLFDFLGADPSRPAGLQILWPFRNEFYMSGLDLFPVTERHLGNWGRVIRINAWAAFVEMLLLVPMVWAARRWATRRRRSRVPISGQAVPRRPSA